MEGSSHFGVLQRRTWFSHALLWIMRTKHLWVSDILNGLDKSFLSFFLGPLLEFLCDKWRPGGLLAIVLIVQCCRSLFLCLPPTLLVLIKSLFFLRLFFWTRLFIAATVTFFAHILAAWWDLFPQKDAYVDATFSCLFIHLYRKNTLQQCRLSFFMFSKNVAFLDIFLPFSCFRVPFIAWSCDDEVIDVRDAGILAVSL